MKKSIGKKPYEHRGSGGDFFGLNRPQYASTPEVFLSSLAWRSVGISSGKPHINNGKEPYEGVVYQRVNRAKKGSRRILETSPRKGAKGWERLVWALAEEFQFEEDFSGEKAASVLVNDLVGNVPARAQSKAVVPLNIFTALMQDLPGMMGVRNPPNFGGILERMYNLGGGEGRASERLIKAYNRMAANQDSGTNWFDHATRTMVPTEISDFARDSREPDRPTKASPPPTPRWLTEGNTPFHWFAASWDKLTGGSWASQMPRRRWVDWASCILRTAMGMGFLFEMEFYYQLVLALKHSDPEEEVAQKLIGVGTTLLVWDGFSSVSSRDIASHIRKTCDRGTACRKLLVETWGSQANSPIPPAEQYANDPDGLTLWLQHARDWFKDQENREEKKHNLKQAITSSAVGGSSNNVHETVAYTLLDRGTSGISEDLYSLFKKRGRRYTIIEPEQEWLVVVASLCAEDSAGIARLSDVVTAVESIGIKVGLKTLTRELERAGLVRASHDADDALEVVAAF